MLHYVIAKGFNFCSMLLNNNHLGPFMSQSVTQFSYPWDGACCHLLMVPRLGGHLCSPWHPVDVREMAVWGDRRARHSKAQ